MNVVYAATIGFSVGCSDGSGSDASEEGGTETATTTGSTTATGTTGGGERPPVECPSGDTSMVMATGEPMLETGSETAGASADAHWVGTWGASPQLTEPSNDPPVSLTDHTLRQFAYVSIGGSELRLEISNEFGDGPVTLNAVQMAVAATPPAIDPDTAVELTFEGVSSVTIPAGEAVYSDAFAFDLSPLSTVAVSMHFGEVPAKITGHPGSRTTSYIASGDAVGAETMDDATTTEHWYYWSRIEVMAPPEAGAVVVLGDSLTDGRGSTTDGNDRWTDALSRRLRANPETALTAVINAGIGGNAVLAGGNGPTARQRFARDVLGQAGVRWVVVFEGINDVGSANTLNVESAVMRSQDVVEAYEEFIAAARAEGLRIYGVPLLPMEGSNYFSNNREHARQYVNEWVRTCGVFDAVLDLDVAVADPAQPTRLLPAYDSSDGLHLNPAGYQAMADAVDLSLFVP